MTQPTDNNFDYAAKRLPRVEESASSVPIPDTGSVEVYEERMRCADIMEDAALKIACQHAAEGRIAFEEIKPRAHSARKAFLEIAIKAYVEAKK